MRVLQVAVGRLLGRLVHGEAPGNRVGVVAMVVAVRVVVLGWCDVVAMEKNWLVVGKEVGLCFKVVWQCTGNTYILSLINFGQIKFFLDKTKVQCQGQV